MLWIGVAPAGPAPAVERAPVTSLLEMRRDRVVVQEWDLSCGAAALATLLNYQHDDDVSEREIAISLIGREEYLANPALVRVRQGFSLLDLKRYVDQRGYLGLGYGRLKLAELVERAPILVPVRLNGFNHFVVFRGMLGNRVLLADPAFGNRTMLAAKFEAAWLDYDGIGKVGFVVARRRQPAAQPSGAAGAGLRLAAMTGARPRSGVACGVVLGAIALALPLAWLSQQIKWPAAESGEIASDAVDVRSVIDVAAPTDGAAPEPELASPAVLDIAAAAPAVAEAGAKALDSGHVRPSRPVARNGVAVIAPAPPEQPAAPAPGASDSAAMAERLAHVPADVPATAHRAAAAEAPVITVRAGRHAGFERLVFDWVEPVGYDIERSAGSLVISFDRPGRIDLSPAVGRLGPRVLSAWTEGGAVTRRTILRVRPDTTFRAFSVYGTRVVIDVLDATGGLSGDARSDAPAAPPSARIQSELLERDLLIADLLARVEQLERERILTPAELDRALGAGLGVSPAGARPSLAPPEAAARTVSQAEPPPARPAAAPERASSGRPSDEPGRLEVEPEAAERALERTLVRTGALLLPYGLAEIEPTFSYARREADAPTFVSNNGDTFVGTTRVRRNEFLIGQDLRVGLPFDSQLEVGAGYRYVDQSTVTMVGFAAHDDDRDSGHGSADFSVGLAKTLLREGAGWWPDLVGRLTWDTNTGRTRNGGVALGGGFNELRVSLSATKRQDPLAFIGSLSYETTFEEDDVKPGDAIGVAIGAVLAASPATSLRTVLSQSFIDETRVDGQTIGGTDRTVGVLTLGASSILGRGISLDIATDIGLSDGLDYAVRASLPVRFNVPVP